MANDLVNAEKYYIRALLLPTIILTKPITIPKGYTRNTWQKHLMSSINNDEWIINGLYLKGIRIKPNQRNAVENVTTNPEISALRSSDKRAISLLDNNMLSMAMSSLNSQPLAPPNMNTFNILKCKHPPALDVSLDIPQAIFQPAIISSNLSTDSDIELTGNDFPQLRHNDESIAIFYTAESMRKYITQCKKKKAPGNSNIRNEHLQQLIANNNNICGENFLGVYTRFCIFLQQENYHK